MRTVAARSVAACSTAWCTSCAGTSTVSLTLFSASSSTCAAIVRPLNQTCTFRRGGRRSRDQGPPDAQAVRIGAGRRRDAARARRPRPLRAEPQADPAVALPRARAGDSRAGSRSSPGEQEALKLRRAPTLVLATARLSGDPRTDEEDLHATACAVYAVLLGATNRGLASYWRTPSCFTEAPVRAALGARTRTSASSRSIHLGPAAGEPPPKERLALDDVLAVPPVAGATVRPARLPAATRAASPRSARSSRRS